MYYLYLCPYSSYDAEVEFFVLRQIDGKCEVLNEDEGGGWIQITEEEFDNLLSAHTYFLLDTLDDVINKISIHTCEFIISVAQHYEQQLEEKLGRIIDFTGDDV